VAGAKYAMARLGLCRDDVRLPLVGVSAPVAGAIDAALRHAGLLN